MLAALSDVIAYIEKYGSQPSADGGHSVMRLSPGDTIAEANFYDDVVNEGSQVECSV